MTILRGLLAALVREPWKSGRNSRVRALLEEGQAALIRGEVDTARRVWSDVIAKDPGNALGHFLLGSIDAQAGLYDSARQRLERCVALGAPLPQALIHLGNVYRLTDDLEQATHSYRKAVDLDPLNPLAHYNLALIARQKGAPEEVLAHLTYAENMPETRGEAVWIRAQTLVGLGRYTEAVEAGRAAVREHSSCYESWVALGYAYQAVHRPRDGLECYDRAFEIRSGDAELVRNYGIVLQDLGRVPEALASYELALRINPGDPLARFHKALLHLLLGDYSRAWDDYEARLLSMEHPRRPAPYPKWSGECLEDRTVLVYGEQGLGDEIMFSSCLPEVIKAAEHCVVVCAPKLRALFSRSFPHAAVYDTESEKRLRGGHDHGSVDFEVAIGSLPLHYRRSRKDFPEHGGYLKADPERVEAWQEKLQAFGCRLNIGVSWQGGTHKTRNPIRSIALERWLPILSIPEVNFVSLQYTPEAPAQIATLSSSHGVTIAHWNDVIDDYDETAALVCALDLVVTVCTSIVHLAGALGRPVWVATPFVPEWRYGLRGERMDWYPSVRLFRQIERGNWEDVIRNMSDQLRTYRLPGDAAC